MISFLNFIIALISIALIAAKDPAQGWLGYAVGTNPSGSGIITKAEATWVVPSNPESGDCF
jgi:hypothetical protein